MLKALDISGAGEGIRTSDLLITSGINSESLCNKMKDYESRLSSYTNTY